MQLHRSQRIKASLQQRRFVRHFGTRVGLALAVVGAILLRSFGARALTQPWNPYMPLVPFLLFVVLCWATLCGRIVALPLAVAVGSYCVQCHVGYAPAVAAGIGVAVLGVAFDQIRARRAGAADHADIEDHNAAGDNIEGGDGPAVVSGRRLGLTLLVAVVVGVVLWIPPLIDQRVHDPGNLRILVQTFRAQTGHLIGLREGGHILLTQLDPAGNWLLGTRRIQGSILGGVLLLLAWGASVVIARRERNRPLLRLHVVLGIQVLCALYWAMRLDSTRYLYLVEWFWVLTGLMVLSVGWGALLLARRFRPQWQADRRWPTLAGVALVISTVAFASTAAGVTPPDLRYSRTVQAIAGPTEARLRHDRTYFVTWVDPDALGGNGFGLFLQLDRAGFDVHAGTFFSAALEPWRVRDVRPNDTVLTVVSGDANIAKARAQPDAKELVATDHRTPAQRRRYQVLQRRAMAQLRAAGRQDLAASVAASIWVALINPTIPDRTFDTLSEMLQIGQGTSVFASPAPLAL